MKAEPGSIAHSLQTEYGAWFKRLQALTKEALIPEQWTGRWFDGYTPEDALDSGPEED